MNYILISLTFLLTFQQPINIEALKRDPIIIQYKKLMHELTETSISRKYQLPTDPNIINEFKKNPTKENMIKLYTRAGMKNAEEYVNKIFLQTKLMLEFLKKHPEITKLNTSKKQDLIRELLKD